ncbi:MAG: crossover junction endodeoxyribonuclease RuvC [Patescibacteria group bacterium]|nr:crossover junction endodeoxyribonuclease RuvC [Patescibacteria group bacterium]
MKILGIDPGTATTGYGIIEQKGNTLSLISFGCIKTNPKDHLAKRLEIIALELQKIIKKFKPDEAAVEELFFAANVKTAIAVGHARGVILLALAKENLKVNEYTPLEVKQALVGYGRAEKRQVQAMVKYILKLEKPINQDDTADALAVAICHASSRKIKSLES